MGWGVCPAGAVGLLGELAAQVINRGGGEGSPSEDGPSPFAACGTPPTGETGATRSINTLSDFCAIYSGHSPMSDCGWKTDLAGAANMRMIMTMLEILLIAAGSLVVLVPLLKERRSIRRLEELRAGAPEVYFEERRSLEAYPPKGSWLQRLIGAAIVIYCATSLVMKHSF